MFIFHRGLLAISEAIVFRAAQEIEKKLDYKFRYLIRGLNITDINAQLKLKTRHMYIEKRTPRSHKAHEKGCVCYKIYISVSVLVCLTLAINGIKLGGFFSYLILSAFRKLFLIPSITF